VTESSDADAQNATGPNQSLAGAPGWLDRAVRASAAGISAEELRAILRGDPPTDRPNPRYRAHVKSFLLHIRPRTYPYASTWFTHTFRLGLFAVFLAAVEVVTGILLMLYYVPTPEGAYESIWRLQTSVPWGEVLRDVHRLAAELMVIVVVLHLLRTFLTRSYKGSRAVTWLTGVALLMLTLLFAFSGYLLPWDQLAYWAVTIGTSMADGVPIIGPELRNLLRGAADIGPDGLLRFYQLHVVLLPLLTALLLGVHYYRVARIHGISLPAKVEEGDMPESERQAATRRIDFIPELLIHEVTLVVVGTLALVVAALLFYDAPLESHADPFRTPLEAKAPWFFLWVQGLLKLGDKTLMGVLIPSALLVVLFLIPFLDRNPSRLWRRRPLALAMASIAVAALGVLTYMGSPSYGITLPAAIEISQYLVPEEGLVGLRAISHTQLPVGVYVVGKTDPATLPREFASVFADFSDRVNAASADRRLPDARALLIVEDIQVDLKRVTLRIGWNDPNDGGFRTYERFIYTHRDAQAMPFMQEAHDQTHSD
jgi:quinol-cytochrome oxidoreductase complex cytochrome b subunit